MSAPSAFRRNLAVVIGIDAYDHGIPALRSAVNDARRLGEMLASDHGFTVLRYFDADASLAALDELLDRRLPAEVAPDDRLLVYFAGHGVALDGDDGPAGFILPQDARRGVADSYLQMTRLHDALEALPCRHLLVVLDSCFAGAFRWSSTRDAVLSPAVVHQERYDRFVHDPAWQVLSSAAYDQTASDQLLTGTLGSRDSIGVHSPFALALFEGLSGAADLSPVGGDGVITVTELYLYLEQRLQRETLALNCRQTPGLWPLRKHDKGEFVFLVPGSELRLPPAPALTQENNPYRGLASFNAQDAPLFFGRAAVIDELASHATRNRVCVVLGASGTGKSSLVKAGLVPQLEMDGGWARSLIVRPGAAPFDALAQALVSGEHGLPPAGVVDTAERIRRALVGRMAATGARTLLVIDQFEELITLTREPAVRAAFLDLLADLIEIGGSRFHLILTLRTDFEAQFDRSRLHALWHAGRFVVPPMSRQDYRAVIEGPASQRVIYFEPSSLVDTLLDDVSAMPGGLPLLSFTLSEMYRRYLERGADNRALTQQDYDALGGVAGALRSRADAEFAALDAAHQGTLRRLMLRMLVVERGALARQRVTRAELEHWDPVESERIGAVLQGLGNARLVVEGVGADGVAYVEPAHDALVTSWGRLLAWTHEAQEREPDLQFLHALAPAAQDWNSSGAGSHSGLLWRDKVRSGRLWALRKADRVQLNRAEDRFCRASVARRRFLRNGLVALIATIVVSSIVAALFGVAALQQREEALSQRNAAQRQALAAWSGTLTSKAGVALDVERDPAVAFKLAAKAVEVDPANVAAAMLLRRSMYGAGLFEYQGELHAAPPYRTLPATDGTDWAVWSPDSMHLAMGRANVYRAPVRILARDGELQGSFDASGLESFRVTGFSRDGRYLLAQDAGAALAWGIDGRAASTSLAGSLEPAPTPLDEDTWEISEPGTLLHGVVYRMTTTPDGAVQAGQAVERWAQNLSRLDAGDGSFQTFVPMSSSELSALGPFGVLRAGCLVSEIPGQWIRTALSRDGRYVATGSVVGEVRLWRVGEGTCEFSKDAVLISELWHSPNNLGAMVTALEFSPDGLRLLACTSGRDCRVWHLTAYALASAGDDPNDAAAVEHPPGPIETRSADGSVVATRTRGNYDSDLSVIDSRSKDRVPWTRRLRPGADVAILDGGLVVASDYEFLRVIDRGGVEEVVIPLSAQLVGHSTDRQSIVMRKYSYGQQGDEYSAAKILPLSVQSLVAQAADQDFLELTPAEIERWDVASILQGVSDMQTLESDAAEPNAWTLLMDSVARLLAPASGSQ